MSYRARDIQRLMKDLEAQGCEVRWAQHKYTVKFPNGGGMTVHLSISDSQRALKNQRSKVRRAGLVWPEWFKV